MQTTQEYNIKGMAGAINFIEAHLKYPIQVGDIADASAYSIFHFCRLFNTIVHHTAYDYLMRRRLTEAAKELTSSSRKVIEIALDYQFNSPEVFNRAFKRFFHMPPRQWKKQPQIERYMPKITEVHLYHRCQMMQSKSIIVESDPIQIQGLMTPISDITSTHDPIWETMFEIPLGKNRMSAFWKNKDTDMYDYCLTGYQSDEIIQSEQPIVTKKFHYQRYLKWQHHNRSTLPFTLDYIFHTWQSKSECRLVQDVILESEEDNKCILRIPIQ